MLSVNTNINKSFGWIVSGLGLMSLLIVGYAVFGYDASATEARLLPAHMRGIVPWKTISEEDIANGTTVPSHQNVIIHIPINLDHITREVLLGHRGEDVRYWGYCFPENYSVALRMRRTGFPGDLFLSEKEREVRREEERQIRRTQFTIPRDLTEADLNETETTRGRIRHQVEVFEGGTTCYIMTEEPLPIGIDFDGDSLNTILEREWNSDPEDSDSDDDGILDGVEVILLKTDPTRRDSDGDGVLDGLEDANRDGRIEDGETNPTEADSDRDGLCDGLCRVGRNGSELKGEDVNLNGVVDDGELDPRNPDSDGDGILDEQEYFNCVLNTGADCKYNAYPVQ